MGFAFHPDDGRPDRIMRFVEPGTLPGNDILSIYDREKNLLVIDRGLFNELSATEQHIVLRTQSTTLRIERVNRGYPTAVPADPARRAA